MDRASSEPPVIQAGAGPNIQIGGFGTRYKVPGHRTGDAVAVVEHTLAPGLLGAAPHRHRHEDEVSYVLEGTLTVQLGDAVVTAGPGAFVVKPRGQFHTFWNTGTETVRFLELIAPAGFARYFEELAPLIPPDRPPDLDAIAALADRYGLEFDWSAVPGLMERHGIRFG
jgi:quercetin dioxygenase-like cupin family protein